MFKLPLTLTEFKICRKGSVARKREKEKEDDMSRGIDGVKDGTN